MRSTTVNDQITAGKRARDALLGLRPGDAVLELGCGLGDDAARLLGLVGPGGVVAGVDAGEALLERAAATHGTSVDWRPADAHELPYGRGSFAAARVEQTLQHVRDPARVVEEMARVVAPGGVVLACEPDWGTAAISGDARAGHALTASAEAGIRHPRIGRRLPALLDAAGVAGIQVRAEAVVLRDLRPDRQPFVDVPGLRAYVIEAGLLDPSTFDGFTATLVEEARAGRLVMLLTLVTAWGRVRPQG